MSELKKGNLTAFVLAAVICVIVLLPLQLLILQYRVEMKLMTAVAAFDAEHPDETADLLYVLYTAELDGLQSVRGENVMEQAGYSKNGLFYFMREFALEPVLLAGICAALASGGILFAAFYRQKRQALQLQQRLASMEEQLREEGSRLQSYQKREDDLKAFIENIAHQIKTPLTRLSMSLDLLEDALQEDVFPEAALYEMRFTEPALHEKSRFTEAGLQEDGLASGSRELRTRKVQSGRLEKCRQQADEIRRLAEGLIQIGRLEAGAVVFHREAFSVKELMEDCASDIRGEKEVQIRCVPLGSEAVWNGSYEWTRQAVSNLLVNCAEHDVSKLPIEITIFEEPDYVRLVLRDHGPGFSPKDLPYLFDRFYRPEKMKAGHVGIGMNLSKLIIQGQNGTITAGNHEDGGAEFLICLPRFKILR